MRYYALLLLLLLLPLPATAQTPAPPDPVAALTPDALRARATGSGEIAIGRVWIRARTYTTYRISYPSDGLTLTGLLHVPKGAGPFPVIIANRGYIGPERYQPGMDSRVFADFMVRNRFLVVAPDYRGYGGGDAGPNPFYTGYAVDTLNLIALAQKLPLARPGPVGMWGHSRGGSITTQALTLSEQIAAAVIYAPAPADLAQDYERRRRQGGGQVDTDTWPFSPAQDSAAYRRVSPASYLGNVRAPVMLHHGTADATVVSSISEDIASGLRASGKTVTLHLYEGGGHTLKGAQERLYLRRTLEFFRAHMT